MPKPNRSRRRSHPVNDLALNRFDALTLELAHVDHLTAHLAERLDALSELDASPSTELQALTLIAGHVRARLSTIGTAAEALLEAGERA